MPRRTSPLVRTNARKPIGIRSSAGVAQGCPDDNNMNTMTLDDVFFVFCVLVLYWDETS